MVRKVNTVLLTRQCVSNFRRCAGGRQAVVYAVSVAHSQALCAAFEGDGYRAAHIAGKTEQAVRDQIIADYRDGKIQVGRSLVRLPSGWLGANWQSCP